MKKTEPEYIPTGWMCPKCKTVNAPNMTKCVACSTPIKEDSDYKPGNLMEGRGGKYIGGPK